MIYMRRPSGVIKFVLVGILLLLAACQAQATPEAQVKEVTKEVVKEVEVTQEVVVTEQVMVTPTATEPVEYESVKIGLSSALTGPIAEIGERYEKGMTLAIEDVGSEVLGRPLELVTADNKCNPSDAVTASRQLIEVEQVNVMLGSGCSGATLGSLPIIKEGETPQVTVASSNPTIYEELGVGGNEWGFRINIDDRIIAKTFSPYIADQGVGTVFAVGENTDFGRGAVDMYQEELPNADVEVLGSEFFDLDATDMRSALTRIKSQNPDALLVVMTEQLGATFMRQVREVGLDVEVYSRGSLTTPLFLELTSDNPAIAEGIVEASFWAKGTDPEDERHWEERWDAAVSAHPMLAYYGTLHVIIPAIECAIQETGEATRAAIRECLEQTSVDTPIGHLEFDDHNQAYPNMTLSTIVDGNIVLLNVIEPERR